MLFLPAADAAAAAEAPPPPAAPPIVVTGQRPPPPGPATVESLDARRIDETTAVATTEDVLRYLPSLLARRRHIGDTQAPLATRTSGVGASARSLVYADGVLLSALIGNNNNNASPRWNMVSPEEVARVEVLYGPFAAAYPGNSIGAVVNLTTRMAERFEATVRAGVSVQRFGQYGTQGTYPAYHESFSIGGKSGRLAWMVSGNRLDARGQPLAYATAARPAAAGGGGLPATGAFADVNRAGAPIYVLGAAGLEAQAQETLRLKLAYEIAPGLRLTYRGGLFVNDTEARAESYLTGPGGPVYAGSVSIDGRAVAIPASAFSANVYTLAERHWMHALGLEAGEGRLQWRLVGSLYDYAKDVQRLPSGALPAAAAGGAGSILRMDGTGWRTLDASAAWRAGEGSAHAASFGAHWDRFRLESRRFATSDWRAGGDDALTQAARGETETAALWAEESWTPARGLQLTLGGRYEWWRARRGFNFSLAPALGVAHPERAQQAFSPKASLRWAPAPDWSVTLSAGQAYRFPTVSELYQAIATGPTITVPDPNLRAERARSEELALVYEPGAARLRLSLFDERIRDALISQSAPLVPGSTALFSFVQNIRAVHTYGVEAAVDWPDFLVHGLELQGSLTLAHPRIVADPAFPAAVGKAVPQVPARRATVAVTYRPDARNAVTLAGRYAGRSFATVDNSDPVSFTYQGFGRYLVIDARATLRVGSHMELGMSVENLTDDRYFLFHPFPGRSLGVDATFRW